MPGSVLWPLSKCPVPFAILSTLIYVQVGVYSLATGQLCREFNLGLSPKSTHFLALELFTVGQRLGPVP